MRHVHSSNVLQAVLEIVSSRLEDYFQTSDPSPESWVTLSNLTDQDGQPYEATRNKIVVYLANLQQDTTISTWNPATPIPGNRFGIGQPTVFINLYLLFYANFQGSNYPQGLGMISQTIQFFQENPVLNHQNLPDLPVKVEKLAFELTNLDGIGLSYLMGLAGVKYLPSVYYKVRMIPFQSRVIQEQVSGIQAYHDSSAPQDTELSASSPQAVMSEPPPIMDAQKPPPKRRSRGAK